MLDIFQEAGLPLWLRPYEVLCTSSYTALIETIPDTVILCSHFTCVEMSKFSSIIKKYWCFLGFSTLYQK